jgi:hypothetical protein
MVSRIEIHADRLSGEAASALRDNLRRSYGIYGVRLCTMDDGTSGGVRLWNGSTYDSVDSQVSLADYVTQHQRMGVADLSCREDASDARSLYK